MKSSTEMIGLRAFTSAPLAASDVAQDPQQGRGVGFWIPSFSAILINFQHLVLVIKKESPGNKRAQLDMTSFRSQKQKLKTRL